MSKFGTTEGDFLPNASLDSLQHTLQRRSDLLRKLRMFFYERGFFEVETPLLSCEVIPELHIEPLSYQPGCWLQASPEAHMKRLVAAGAKAIFQVTRSFRAGEQGRLHNREFTLVEWYRTGDSMVAGMQLLDELCQQLLCTAPAKRTSYDEAFQRYVGLRPHAADCEMLAKRAKELSVAIPDSFEQNRRAGKDRDEWLNLFLATRVEPELGRDVPEMLYHYPTSQAALAKVSVDETGTPVAERFELYWQGVELANGYHELTDAVELRRRLTAVNTLRQAEGCQSLPLPERLLEAMEAGLPDCTGVALGFDRLVMLAVGAKSIDRVMSFTSE